MTYEPCEFEHHLNSHLSTCSYKKRCDYQKLYSGIRTPYCRKKASLEEAERMFAKMKQDLERKL